jgi:hemerythrin-like domain-containing protein
MTDKSSVADDLRPFAFLRLTHEAIRVACGECSALVAGDTVPERTGIAALKGAVEETLRELSFHAQQEDNGLYPLIDGRFDDAAKNEGYREEHEQLHADEAALQEIVAALAAAPDEARWRAARDAVIAWADTTEKHLQHEENILQPFTSRLTDEDLVAACEQVHTIIDAADRAQTESRQVGWVAQKLETGRPFGKLKKYVLALQHTATADEYARIKRTVQASISPDAWQKLDGAGLCGDGQLAR